MVAWTTAAIPVLLLGLSWTYVKDRYEGIALMKANAPGSLKNVSTFASYEIKFDHDIRNCEDVVLDEEKGFALLSCDTGRDLWNTVMGTFIDQSHAGQIYFYPYASNPDSLPIRLSLPTMPDSDFHPLGIDYHSASGTLAVINHASPGPSISFFKLSVDSSSPDKKPAVEFLRTIRHPMLATPNAIHLLSETEMYITNDHFFPIRTHGVLAILETYLAIPGGDVVHLTLHRNPPKPQDKSPSAPISSIHRLARVPFANGVHMLNATHLAVSCTARPGLYIYEVIKSSNPAIPNPSLELKAIHKTPFWPDNLSSPRPGAILITGHPFPPDLTKVAKNQHKIPAFEPGLVGQQCGEECVKWVNRPRAQSAVSEWTEEGGLKELFVDAGGAYGCSTTAVHDFERKIGIVVGLYERGILVWKD